MTYFLDTENSEEFLEPFYDDEPEEWLSREQREINKMIEDTSCHAYISERGALNVVSFRYQEVFVDYITGEEHFRIQNIWTCEVEESEIPELLKRLDNEQGEILGTLGARFPNTFVCNGPCVPYIDTYDHGPTFGKLVVDIDPFNVEFRRHLVAVLKWADEDPPEAPVQSSMSTSALNNSC